MLLFLNGYHGNNKNITVVFQMCQTIHPQNYMFVLAVQTEIFDTGYCWIVHLSFLTSHNLLFFRFCKTSKKTTFSVFLSFFLVKSPKSQCLKLNISRTAWPILMVLVSFCRILNGLSDEINLFWRCSSPLNRVKDVWLWKLLLSSDTKLLCTESSAHAKFKTWLKMVPYEACFHFISLFCCKALTVKVEKMCKNAVQR